MVLQTGLLRAQLAKLTGCNLETIRYYEKVGLLPPPPRSANGYRVYSPDLTQRLRFILRARDIGFSMEETRRRPGFEIHEWRERQDAMRKLRESARQGRAND